MAKRRELTRVIKTKEEIKFTIPWLTAMVEAGLPGGPVQVGVSRERRTVDQNAKLWPMLTDIERQVNWHGFKLTRKEWKEVLTASLKSQKVVPAIDGGFVVIGSSTSQMRKKEFCDLVELIYAFGAEHGVVWSEPKKNAEELWRAAA